MAPLNTAKLINNVVQGIGLESRVNLRHLLLQLLRLRSHLQLDSKLPELYRTNVSPEALLGRLNRRDDA